MMYLLCRNMKAVVQKWGNSLALRIPKSVAEEIEMREGGQVELRLLRGGLLVRPMRQKYKLSELLKEMTPGNRHGETDWGADAGREQV